MLYCSWSGASAPSTVPVPRLTLFMWHACKVSIISYEKLSLVVRVILGTVVSINTQGTLDPWPGIFCNREKSDQKLSRCSALKLFPKLTAAGCHQERGQQFSTFWVACAHCLNYWSTLPFPTPLLSSLFSSSRMTHKLGSHPLPQTPKTEFQHHVLLAPIAPP